MAVTAKEKKQLQENWSKAEAGSGVDVPDGTYQVKITSARFHETSNGKYQMKVKYKIVGGDEEYTGKEFELAENLETPQNMGFFKDKLRRLNIPAPEDFDEVMDGTVADQLKGKVFEGQVKTKNNFLNVYVNRLVAEGKGGEEEEETEEKDNKKSDIEEGAKVTWNNGKKGEVIEVLADDNQARVQKEDGSIVRVALNLLSLDEESDEKEEKEDEEQAEQKGSKSKKKKDEDEEEEDEEEEDDEDGEFEIPEADDVEDMSAKEVKSALEALDFEASDLKNARAVLHAFCTLAHDKKAKIQLEEIAPLADALGVEFGKKDDFKTKMNALSEAVQEKLG